MANNDKLEAVKKMLTLLTGYDFCNCTKGGPAVKSAMGNLGYVGSNNKKMKPSILNYKNISPNPMAQKQLGDKEDNPFLAKNKLQPPTA